MQMKAEKIAALGFRDQAADATIPKPNITTKHEHAQMLRIKKLKGSGIIGIAARHNLREIQAEIGADSHINTSRTPLNVILRGAGTAADVAAEALGLMEQAGVLPLRKGAVTGLEILFSLPPDSGIDELKYFSACANWSAKFYEILILSAVIHNDEAAPHCHVLLLPLFDGRMIGSDLMGSRARLQAMQADFHAKVGQVYGLARQAPAKRHSATVRADAARSIVKALQRSPKALSDPAICDALRDALAISLPANLMEMLKLDMPEVKTRKPKTFSGIMIQNKPERKNKNPIGNFADINPIGNTSEIRAKKTHSLCSVGKRISPPIVPPENPSVPDHCDDEYTRIHDDDLTAGYWDAERGEMIQTPPRTRTTDPAIEQVRKAQVPSPCRCLLSRTRLT